MTTNLTLRSPARWWNLGSLALLSAWLVTVALMLHGSNDLDIFLQASGELVNGRNPYSRTYFEWYSYFYSPVFAWVVAPLRALPLPLAKLIWGLLSLAAALRTVHLLLERTARPLLNPTLFAAVRFFALLVLFQSVRDNINLSQVTLLLVWACVEGLGRIERGDAWTGGLLIAGALDMKLIPLVLLPYLAYRGHWRGLVAVISCVAALQLAPFVVLGIDRGTELFHSRWAQIDPNSVRHILDEEEPSMLSWGSLLSAYLSVEGGGTNTLELPRNLAQLSVGTIAALVWCGRILFGLFALYFLRWPPFRKAGSPLHAGWELAYLLLVSILVFPHQRPYSLFLAAPAVVWLCTLAALRVSSSTAKPWGWLTLCCVGYLGLNALFLAGEFDELYDHYKLFSFVVLLLLGMLAWSTPERLRTVDGPR
jgi:hypothetical protein